MYWDIQCYRWILIQFSNIFNCLSYNFFEWPERFLVSHVEINTSFAKINSFKMPSFAKSPNLQVFNLWPVNHRATAILEVKNLTYLKTEIGRLNETKIGRICGANAFEAKRLKIPSRIYSLQVISDRAYIYRKLLSVKNDFQFSSGLFSNCSKKSNAFCNCCYIR